MVLIVNGTNSQWYMGRIDRGVNGLHVERIVCCTKSPDTICVCLGAVSK